MEWEYLEYNLYRAKIPGGWLVKQVSDVIHLNEHHGMVGGYDIRASICFVPDEGHYWQILNKNEA